MTKGAWARMKAGLLERLNDGVVLGDGGYLLELEKRGYVRAGPFTPEVSITHPDALVQLHREFLRAGADVLQALTFYASENKLATVGLGDKLEDINREAISIARRVASEGAALVAMTLSMTWGYDPSDPSTSDRVREMFDRQLGIAMDCGVDLIIGETFTWLGEALIAVERATKTGVPVVTTVGYEKEARTHDGYDSTAAAKVLTDAGSDVVGINCLWSPQRMLPEMAKMRAAVSTPLACQPIAYDTGDVAHFTALSDFPFRLDPHQLTRHALGDYATQARALGIEYIGSCCGSVAAHVRAMARALGKLPDDEVEWKRMREKPMSAFELHGHTDI